MCFCDRLSRFEDLIHYAKENIGHYTLHSFVLLRLLDLNLVGEQFQMA
jgi:hypothetical protein